MFYNKIPQQDPLPKEYSPPGQTRGRIHQRFCVQGEDPSLFCARAWADPEGSRSILGALLAYFNANVPELII